MCIKLVLDENYDENDEYVWIQNNIEPWPKVQEVWRRTYNIRMKRLKEDSSYNMFKTFPALKEKLGYTLVS